MQEIGIDKGSHLDTEALASRWGMSTSTLENWRSLGKGPSYMKIGARVLYPVKGIETYEAESIRTSTSMDKSQEVVNG